MFSSDAVVYLLSCCCLQTKLHDADCGSRSIATIATHDIKSLTYPLVYDALVPADIMIQPLGMKEDMPAPDFVAILKQRKEAEEKKKKRQQLAGVYKYAVP